MNPSVEEVKDESSAGASNGAASAEDGQLSWSKICSQHDSVLVSHLEMLNSAKELAHSDDDFLLRAISPMLETTNKLMSQFRVVKKQMMNRTNGSTAAQQNTRSRSVSTQPADPKSTISWSSQFMEKKRARMSHESTTVNPDPDYSNKRKRLDVPIPGSNEDTQNATAVSTETEDISEEVQRRLEIKEEQRRKRNARPEKRKRDRDSFVSDGGAPSLGCGSTDRPKKRRREVTTAET